MASVNDLLIPKPQVMAVQAVIFCAALVIIKKFIIDPYLKVRDKRESFTSGSKDQAKDLIKKSSDLDFKIESSLNKAREDSRQIKKEKYEAAIEQKEKIVSQADADAKATVGAMTENIKKQISEEKALIPAFVAQLTEQFYEKTLQ